MVLNLPQKLLLVQTNKLILVNIFLFGEQLFFFPNGTSLDPKTVLHKNANLRFTESRNSECGVNSQEQLAE